ncbi:sensor histidine kinase [Terrisporobacter mayombei]|uniref:Heme sensor protein HssS n=1 Tax=Terrisporobacter mayombei TaxID=1541 RepID=A0ABY9Q094_9FIRM|nr:HAMP domain-containing sensor histidine kinase [Terrisporobacter mayombei]MCC3868284.1 HAMP domain-containing histidine kinase [Terrisporobacter mayombei]WMT80425.1 Adaptive-response sensory-kinase SasA [Terrisporobacter mayombei]
MKLKHNKTLHFWINFIINIFITSSITIFIVSIGFSLGTKLNIVNNEILNDFWGLILFILINIALASVFTFIIIALANNFMKPVKKLIEATDKVSKGDFSIRLDEKNVHPGVLEMNVSFNKMVNELSSIETLRNDFIVNVSHEFKTPIAAIEGYATLLQDTTLTEDERMEYTNIILDSSRQLSSLSGNILKLSKLENQEIIPDKKYFSLDEQLRQALLLLETQWSKKNIDIDMDLKTISYYGSEDLLMQVWLNIFSNAIKFTSDGGLIVTTLNNTSKGISVSISDNGIGMTDEVQSRIFDRFYQGDKSRSFQGNGLGLTLVKRILDLCNCDINVKSKVNEGTTFNITLPIKDKEK